MPLLKKSSLDRDTMKNYRSISNLSFVSKVVDRVVASQLNAHMLEHSLLEPAQSAYRRNHSTESALLQVRSDVLQAIGGKKCVMLVLFDLSAAFDTIDHEILLLRLEINIGVCGSALAWFRSYLSERTQSVRIHNTPSQPQPLHYGVPQGSVLGPVLFTVYSAPIAAIARQRGLSVQLYADDTQLYLTFDIADAPDSISRIEACLLCIRWWMADNKLKPRTFLKFLLKLNDEKTIVLFLRAPSLGPQPNISGLTIGNTFISCSASARHLGAIFDQHLSMEAHVRNVCSSAFYHLHHISRMRDVLDIKTAATIVQALVISRLDYCNSLL